MTDAQLLVKLQRKYQALSTQIKRANEAGLNTTSLQKERDKVLEQINDLKSKL